jgi:hypothetical protein
MPNFSQFKGVVVAFLLIAAPVVAHAQATRTWVSGVGDDVNPCSRTAPCKTFAGAISKTAAGGEIDVLDPGGFGAVTITKAITIGTDPAYGGTLSTSTNGIVINAGPNDIIMLRGLSIHGGNLGLAGVKFMAGGGLVLTNCVIQNSNATPSYGVQFVPNQATPARLFITNTLIENNGSNGSALSNGSGIYIAPSSTGDVYAELRNVSIPNNNQGILAYTAGNPAGGSIQMSISDSSIASSNRSGISAWSAATGAKVSIVVRDSSVFAHRTVGQAAFAAEGAQAKIWVGGSSVSNNANAALPTNGGTIFSFGNNEIQNNVIVGTFTPVALN